MDLSEMQTRSAELEQQISALPAGSVTKKTVSGKDYFYHRWTENKKRREKYIPADELENFRAQIERRKELEQELKALKKQLPNYLRKHREALYTIMLMENTLNPHLEEIDRQAQEMEQHLISQLAQQEGVTEQLKAENQMEWVE